MMPSSKLETHGSERGLENTCEAILTMLANRIVPKDCNVSLEAISDDGKVSCCQLIGQNSTFTGTGSKAGATAVKVFNGTTSISSFLIVGGRCMRQPQKYKKLAPVVRGWMKAPG